MLSTTQLRRRQLMVAAVVLPVVGCAENSPNTNSMPQASNLAGSWAYRSFLNNPDVAEDFGKLRVGTATIEIAPYSGSAFVGTFVSAAYKLNLSGHSHGDQFSMRAVQGSPNTEGWVYEYKGWIAAHWDNAIDQLPTLVGTTIRVGDHVNARGTVSKGGATYSFMMVRQA